MSYLLIDQRGIVVEVVPEESPMSCSGCMFNKRAGLIDPTTESCTDYKPVEFKPVCNKIIFKPVNGEEDE
jgi:hypothetical protein